MKFYLLNSIDWRRIMKITLSQLIIALILTGMSYAENIKAQAVLNRPINITIDNSSLGNALRQIEKNANVKFVYSRNIIQSDQEVSVFANDEKLETILSKLLKPLGVSYEVISDRIVLSKAPVPGNDPVDRTLSSSEVQVVITGKVTSADGGAMPGVSVKLKGTTGGATSDSNGKYTINVPSTDGVLIFTYIGFTSKEVIINGRTLVNVQLDEVSKALSEVVVVGYGTMKKADLTGAVGTVNSEDLNKTTSTNLGQAIQGRMSGVQVTQTSGQPGAGADIKVRGVGSVKSGNSPLVLVDGFVGSTNDLDADDVESITVLKDASAAAIYGSRAANGVLLITTKKGRAGKSNVEFKSEYGWQSLSKKPNYLTGPEWAERQNEARKFNGNAPFWVGTQAPETITQWTDWSDYVFSTAPIQDYHIGINGGNDKTKYAVGVGYINQKGTIIGTDFNRANVRVNLQQELSKSIRAGVNMSYIRSGYETTITAFSSSQPAALNGITAAPPTIPAYNPDGFPGAPRPGFPGEAFITNTTWKTPSIANDILDNFTRTNRTFGNLFAEADILQGLKYKLVLNGSVSNNFNEEWTSKWAIYSPTDLNHTTPLAEGPPASLRNISRESYVWEIQNLLTYDRVFGKHSINALLGFSAEKGDGYEFEATKSGFPNNDLRAIGAGNIPGTIAGGFVSPYSLISQFARINYSYNNRYLFQANVRRDGSSVFAPGRQYGVYPSFSAGWRISEESFMKNQKVISNLKIRGSWGQLGNANIPAYSWISTIDVTGGAVFGNPQTRQPAYFPTQMSNDKVKWETTTTTDMGIEIGFFKDRLSFEADFYDKRTTDMLLDATIPYSGGFTAGPVANIGEVQNKGWELMVKYQDRSGDFNYSGSFNLSHNKNVLLDLGGVKPIRDKPLRSDEGLPLYAYWGYEAMGIWNSKAEADANPHMTGDRGGMVRFKDLNGDGLLSDADKTFIGSYMPKYVYGFNFDFSWKGIDLSVLFQGEKDKDMLVESVFGGNGEGENNNVDRYYWDNRAKLDANGVVVTGTTPAAGAVKGDMIWSSFLIQDASYLRIKNMQLGYTFSKRLTAPLKIQSLRLYLNATNLITCTDFIGYDPEMKPSESNGAYSRGGVDAYPVAKSITVGARLVF
ncbi:TonB-linked outer membrane protein, SusC/RagA family [Pedobacter sp. ok626]|uniref:TonB-dependent receptor n=1 Tax=Pedobacter sp. ok626 TaxID=1761882 RepID=UPI00088F7656|nr:TonB-dependent receptor [Pedobacter sp. ok626]SDL05091.1 TonB-linked outer membrane protein, SusC/RagA family [Pedobacter sp. ok626]